MLLSLSGVIRGISPTDAIPLHHLADDASTAILFVPRINESDIESKTYVSYCGLYFALHRQGRVGDVTQNVWITNLVINQLTDLLTKLRNTKLKESCVSQ
jgi:hypothetical protein